MMELNQLVTMLTDEDKERISKAMVTKIEQEVAKVDIQGIAEDLLENVCMWINDHMELDDLEAIIKGKIKEKVLGMLK
jgi:hypothetical protein